MKTFQIKHYDLKFEKIKNPINLVVLADLHGLTYGEENQVLVDSIEKQNPDAILIAGDMIVSRDPETLIVAEKLLEKLSSKYPIYYATGNHELKLFRSHIRHREYWEFENRIKAMGVKMVRNDRIKLYLKENPICIYGLELPVEYYKKPFPPKLFSEEVRNYIGKPNRMALNILLAHNPRYAKAYFGWGADLILSGHYHGGILRFTEHVGAISPQYQVFPPYCCGHFATRRGQHLVVSAGLGEHTLPLRIHNPRELLVLHLLASE